MPSAAGVPVSVFSSLTASGAPSASAGEAATLRTSKPSLLTKLHVANPLHFRCLGTRLCHTPAHRAELLPGKDLVYLLPRHEAADVKGVTLLLGLLEQAGGGVRGGGLVPGVLAAPGLTAPVACLSAPPGVPRPGPPQPRPLPAAAALGLRRPSPTLVQPPSLSRCRHHSVTLDKVWSFQARVPSLKLASSFEYLRLRPHTWNITCSSKERGHFAKSKRSNAYRSSRS